MELSEEDINAIKDIQSRQTGGWAGQFSISEGWYPLVADLHRELLKIDPTYSVQQVKEKFGGLRFYSQPENRELDDQTVRKFRQLVHKAEEGSLHVCEECGGIGTHRNVSGMVATLCTVHFAEARERMQEAKRVLREGAK